jgi:multidrug resistance protein, MATE family
LAEFSFALVGFLIIKRKKLLSFFHIQLFAPIQKSLSRDTLAVAYPVILQYFFSIGSWLVFYFFVEHLGKDELAISQLLRSVFGLVGAGSWAMASTANTMVSNLIGQQRYSDVFLAIRKICTVSFCVAFVLSILYLFFAKEILSIYTDDAALLEKAVAPAKIVVYANLLLAISNVVFNAVLGTGNTKANMTIEFSAIIIYMWYIYTVIEKYRMGLSWAWGSELVYWSSIVLMALSYLRWGKWREKKI